ncbi:FMN phosphatase YigB (HAD superfamily) [Nonomuraea thailandensis]|uniref:FMN phosphatase YigB (HAD superfamily) n=1 Tax=Nonomuraea thailandensis TaxID=1188745 RepID=A0A9X2K4T9_9ACTN|nr:FMN phosphatase YigB (HAD superfamily) [Nonomuraea thailandensis]
MDYGGTLSAPNTHVDPVLGQRPVDPRAIIAVRELHDLDYALALSSNNRPGQDRSLALRQAGIEDMFDAVVTSEEVGVGKPAREFYRRVIATFGVPPDQVMSVGNNLTNDVVGALQYGFGGAVLIRHDGALRTGEVLPAGAVMITHIDELADLLRRSPWPLRP